METGFSLKYNISIKGCLILNTLLKIFFYKIILLVFCQYDFDDVLPQIQY